MLYDPSCKPEAKPIEMWRQYLLDAARLIEERGHAKCRLEGADGSLCAVGAINYAMFGRSISLCWPREALKRFSLHLGSGDTIAVATWNNKPERTAAEVVKAMRDCAASRS